MIKVKHLVHRYLSIYFCNLIFGEIYEAIISATLILSLQEKFKTPSGLLIDQGVNP